MCAFTPNMLGYVISAFLIDRDHVYAAHAAPKVRSSITRFEHRSPIANDTLHRTATHRSVPPYGAWLSPKPLSPGQRRSVALFYPHHPQREHHVG